MAPTKEKAKKSTAEEGSAMVLDYLQKQNRPYSATDISANLHNKVSKSKSPEFGPFSCSDETQHMQPNSSKISTTARRSKVALQVFILNLHCQAHTRSPRVTGKQLVYHSIQAPPSSSESPADLAALDKRATALREGIAEAKATEKALRSQLTLVSAATSPEDLKSTVEALVSQKAGLEDRLVELKQVNVTPVSEVEKTYLEGERAKWKKLSEQRKGVFKLLWQHYVDVRMDSTEERIKEVDLWEEAGCDGEMPR